MCEYDRQCPAGYWCGDDGVCRVDTDSSITPDALSNDAESVDSGSDTSAETRPIGPDGRVLTGSLMGESCDESVVCRIGLICVDGTCEAVGETTEGATCVVSDECADGLGCGLASTCVPSPEFQTNASCAASEDCEAGLRCELHGLLGMCVSQGDSDVGQPCELDGDCMAPLGCSEASVCQIPIYGGFDRFEGPQCEGDIEGHFRVLFEVPTTDPPTEFYRLPFPNDIRSTDTGVDMTGHARPDDGELGAELFDGIFSQLEQHGRGFSTNPTIFFRFSRTYAFDSITGSGDEPSLMIVNIDPDSPNYGRRPLNTIWFMNHGGGRFICPIYLAVRPGWSARLDHSTTYAVLLTTEIRSTGGGTIEPDEDFAALVSLTEPEDDDLLDAWTLYQPFRDYLADQAIDPTTIAAATVFTTMDPDQDMDTIRDTVVAAATDPVINELTVCGDDVVSPCDDGADRTCVNTDDGFYEIHFTYEAPIWQNGLRPYLGTDDGGAFAFTDGGLLEVQDTEDICASLTIPLGDPPASGWPVLLYAHGTGGSFVSQIHNGVAAQLTDIDIGDESNVGFATINIDGAQHGPRRGESELSPEVLFFNYGNPAAALGNVQQGVADYFFLTQILDDLQEASADLVGGAVQFDANHLFFYGHSQGSTVGSLFVAYEPTVRVAVFSGAGASLELSLIHKTNPVDVSAAVELVLNEGASDLHPALALIQQVFDPVDATNYGTVLAAGRVAEETTVPHVLTTFGVGDTYTPDPTIEVFANAIANSLAVPSTGELGSVGTVDYPVSGNRSVYGEPITSVIIMYESDGYDGHFVATRHEDALRQVSEFLGTAYRDGVPTVSE